MKNGFSVSKCKDSHLDYFESFLAIKWLHVDVTSIFTHVYQLDNNCISPLLFVEIELDASDVNVKILAKFNQSSDNAFGNIVP